MDDLWHLRLKPVVNSGHDAIFMRLITFSTVPTTSNHISALFIVVITTTLVMVLFFSITCFVLGILVCSCRSNVSTTIRIGEEDTPALCETAANMKPENPHYEEIALRPTDIDTNMNDAYGFSCASNNTE